MAIGAYRIETLYQEIAPQGHFVASLGRHGPKGPRNDAVVVGWHITVTTANNHFPFHLLCAKRPC